MGNFKGSDIDLVNIIKPTERKTIKFNVKEPDYDRLGGVSLDEKKSIENLPIGKCKITISKDNPDFIKMDNKEVPENPTTGIDETLTKRNYGADVSSVRKLKKSLNASIKEWNDNYADRLKQIKDIYNIMNILGITTDPPSSTDKYNMSLEDIHNIVQSGKADIFFSVGEQIIVPWTDIVTGIKYDVPLDIVQMQDVKLKDGQIVPGMFLQWHYAIPINIPFDQYEAIYIASDESLPAGTYNITVGDNWGTYCKKGEVYQFTLTKPIPRYGVLVGLYRMPDMASSEWRIISYSSISSSDIIETVPLSLGNGGTSLGTLAFGESANDKLNSIQRIAYGNNRWSQSSLRQFLNSNEPIGEWWAPQGKFDRFPNQLYTNAGFMTGFDEDFLNCIKPVMVSVANSSTITEITFDTFFIPSLDEMNIFPQNSGEGNTWDYWKQRSGIETKMNQYGTYPQIVTYGIEDKTIPQTVRLRTINDGTFCSNWTIFSSGGIGIANDAYAYRVAPVCVIC